MMFTIPNLDDIGEDAEQAEVDSKDIQIVMMGLQGTGVISGCAMTEQGAPDDTVAVAEGVISYEGILAAVTAGNVDFENADGTNDRFDYIMTTNAGVLVDPSAGDGKGTAAADPVFPAIPANRVILGVALIVANDNVVHDEHIVDKRVPVDRLAEVLDSTATEVEKSNSANLETLYTFTVPAGYLAAGDSIRLTLALGLLNNKGSPGTIAYTFDVGGVSQTSNTPTYPDSASGAEGWAQFLITVEDNDNWEVGGFHRMGRPVGGHYAFAATEDGDQYAAAIAYPGTGVDLTSGTVTIAFKSQMSAAHANFANTLRSAVLEFLPAP